MKSSLVPSEDWPPYRWLWTHVRLARDPETGEPTPYTHGMRRHPAATLVALGLVVVVAAWWARRFWPVLLSFAAGALVGHVFW